MNNAPLNTTLELLITAGYNFAGNKTGSFNLNSTINHRRHYLWATYKSSKRNVRAYCSFLRNFKTIFFTEIYDANLRNILAFLITLFYFFIDGSIEWVALIVFHKF